MRVDAIRRAGHQGHAILTRHDFQLRRVVRLDHRDTVHLIAERSTHHFDVEVVADTHFIEPREHGRLDQSAMPGEHRMRALAADWQAAAVQVARARSERRFGGAMVDRQSHGNFRNANRTHHATAGIQQTPVLRVRRTGACGTSVRGTGVRACTRTTLIVRFTRIGHTGTRSAAHISERILRLTQNRLSGFRKPLVIVLGRGERVIRLRIRPARNRLRGSYRRSRQITRRPILQHRRKTANTDRSDNQQRRNRTHRQRFAASVTSLTHFVGNVNRLFERRKATFQRKSTTHRSLFG